MAGASQRAEAWLAAAFVAAGCAAVALGVLALLRYGSTGVDRWLTWRPAAEMIGPGAIALTTGLVAWLVMVAIGRPRRVGSGVIVVALALVAVAVVLAFPPLDQLLS